MLSKFIKTKMKYDGRQLRPLWAYQNFNLLGDSIVSWIGSCNVDLKNMVDVEDQISNSKICGDLMLHFIVEVFDRELFSAVCLQRIMASLIKDYLHENSKVLESGSALSRDGDDLFWQKQKLSISIASCSAVSNQVHFAVNIVNKGTPVKTCCLNDFKVKPEDLAKDVMERFVSEYKSIRVATQKVHPL